MRLALVHRFAFFLSQYTFDGNSYDCLFALLVLARGPGYCEGNLMRISIIHIVIKQIEFAICQSGSSIIVVIAGCEALLSPHARYLAHPRLSNEYSLLSGKALYSERSERLTHVGM
ncbi:hypothetical protein VTL71DRAFT_14847 [Oculimacula yallundae]|uniref:Secreted protein n=1 Tax=Oculimacula yallundae TaxID=86028 RepID=A0ABR4CEY6_9HELO